MKKNKKGKMGYIHNPHDKALFLSLINHEVARDAMRAYFPKDLMALTDLKNIRQYKTKLVSPEYKAFEADIIYEVELNDKEPALVLFHCEQQTSVEKFMPLRIWQYMLLILMEYAKNHPKKELPIIYPVILYTGKNSYTESTDFFDLFTKQKNLAKKYMLGPIHLVDVHRMADEDIEKHRLFGLTEYAFKHKETKKFEAAIKKILPWVSELELQLGRDYAKMILRYVVEEYKTADYEILLSEMKQHLSKELEEEAMTIAEKLKNEGMQQGMQQEKYVIAKNLLQEKLDINLIIRTTGLDKKQILSIKVT